MTHAERAEGVSTDWMGGDVLPLLVPARLEMTEAELVHACLRVGLRRGDVIAVAQRLYPLVRRRGSYTPAMWARVWDELRLEVRRRSGAEERDLAEASGWA